MEKTKPNTTKAVVYLSKEMYYNTNKHRKAMFSSLLWHPVCKQRGPILISALHKFHLLTNLDSYPLTYSHQDPHGASWIMTIPNYTQLCCYVRLIKFSTLHGSLQNLVKSFQLSRPTIQKGTSLDIIFYSYYSCNWPAQSLQSADKNLLTVSQFSHLITSSTV